MSDAFHFGCRVYYEDTDAGGIVYYANYLKFMERARTEWLRALGLDIDRLVAQHNTLFVVRSVSVDYLRPARLNQWLGVTVQPTQAGGASFALGQNVWHGDQELVRGTVRLACLDAERLAPRALPDELQIELTKWRMP